jgi:hypothetical protein
MIYSVEECGIILKILKRKELERTIFTTLETLPLSFRSAMDCQLSLDIKRCEAM